MHFLTIYIFIWCINNCIRFFFSS